jgi:hypothetical protein
MRNPAAATLVLLATVLAPLAIARAAEATASPHRPPQVIGEQLAQRGSRPCEPNCGSFGGGARGPQPGSPAHIVRASDQNGDGKVSRDEFRGPPPAFDLIDADSDGFATADEFAAFQKRRESGDLPVRAAPADVPKLPVIATHTHILAMTDLGNRAMDWAGATKNALARMDVYGIRTAVIMPTPMHPDRSDDSLIDGFFEAARKHPDRFVVVGGGASLNGIIQRTRPDRVSERVRKQFAQRAEEIIRKGAVGFGEMTALHFSFFGGHPFEETRPDHPLFLLLADIAAKYDVPIDLHVEAVAHDWAVSDQLHRQSRANPDRVSENIAAFERLLAHNRRARIIWVHVGMDSTGHRSTEVTRRLLRENANLYLSITSFQNAVGDEWFFRPGAGLHPAWRDLILEFPDRFMIGTDAFFLPDNPSVKMPDRTRIALATVQGPALPPDVKRKIAFENAQRVFKLTATGSTPPLAAPVTPPPPRPASAPGFLSETEIRQTVIGNTLNFVAPSNGRNLYVYFSEDGSAAVKAADPGLKVIVKRWFFNDKGMLCRTVGPADRNHCTRVKSTNDRNTLTLLTPRVEYQATVIGGRSLPQ